MREREGGRRDCYGNSDTASAHGTYVPSRCRRRAPAENGLAGRRPCAQVGADSSTHPTRWTCVLKHLKGLRRIVCERVDVEPAALLACLPPLTWTLLRPTAAPSLPRSPLPLLLRAPFPALPASAAILLLLAWV